MPDKNVIYGLSDIHGMAYHLENLLRIIYDDFEKNGYEFGEIVFCGDYVDRGPNSKEVLDILIEGSQIPELQFITLLGNHDDALFTAGKYWTDRYATATLKSFGVSDVKEIDRKYLNFMERLWLKYESGPFFFCHAGIDPTHSLKDQIREDLLWIRHEFLQCNFDFEKIIVHGHTPNFGHADVRKNRVNVDSHCYASGVLSAMKYDGSISILEFKSKRDVIGEYGGAIEQKQEVAEIFGGFDS